MDIYPEKLVARINTSLPPGVKAVLEEDGMIVFKLQRNGYSVVLEKRTLEVAAKWREPESVGASVARRAMAGYE